MSTNNLFILGDIGFGHQKISRRLEKSMMEMIDAKLTYILKHVSHDDTIIFAGQFTRQKFEVKVLSYLIEKLTGYNVIVLADGHSQLVNGEIDKNSTIGILNEVSVVDAISYETECLKFGDNQEIILTAENNEALSQDVRSLITEGVFILSKNFNNSAEEELDIKLISPKISLNGSIYSGHVVRKSINMESSTPSFIKILPSGDIEKLTIPHEQLVFENRSEIQELIKESKSSFVDMIASDQSIENTISMDDTIKKALEKRNASSRAWELMQDLIESSHV